MLSFVFCIVICLICGVQPGALPVEKCKLEDSKCLVSEFQKAVPVFMAGIPEYDVAVEDVMHLDPVQFDLSGLQFSLNDGRVKGLKNSVIDNVKWNAKKNKFEVDFHADCNIKGHYTAGGRLLILPITGDGQLTLKLKNISVKFYVDYVLEKDGDGKDIVVPKKYVFNFDVKDDAHFTLTGLFNGDKTLGDAMHTFLNDNWKQVVTEFGTPLMEAAAKQLYVNISNFFKHSPLNDITA